MKWIPIPEILILTGTSSIIWAMFDIATGASARETLIEASVGVVCLIVGLKLRWRAPWA